MSDTYHPETSVGAKMAPSSAAEDLKRTAQHAKETAGTAMADVREGVAQGTARVKQEAAARTESAKASLAEELTATADALGSAAREMEGHSLQRNLLSQASEGLTSVSRAIEGKSVGDIVSDLAAFGRRNPVVFLGGATLAGFALARLAQASAPDGGRASAEAGASGAPPKAMSKPKSNVMATPTSGAVGAPKPGTLGSADAGTIGEPRPVGAGDPFGGGTR